ncbi:MAG: lamin tail domain-containing protein [Phycisphaerae bacterium]|nr:lamin tail domain-containing protein [Phycisphaerae bacterium]
MTVKTTGETPVPQCHSTTVPQFCHRLLGLALAAVILTALTISGPVDADCPPIPPSEYWKNSIDFPDDPFVVPGSSSEIPGWVKFTVLACDMPFTPDTPVYFQDSQAYPYHYEFCTELLSPIFGGMSHQAFEDATLYNEGRLGFLGAVLVPPMEGWPPEPVALEYGIEFVSFDPLPKETVRDMFYAVMSGVNADPEVQAFYFPTYHQQEQAQLDSEWFAAQDPPIIVSSSARWSTQNVVYSEGWALGEVKYFDGDDIENAYLQGLLEPWDILLTDGVPSEVPFVAGILTVSPSTPNSHVAILANTYGIPFVYLALEDDAALAQQLVGTRIALRAYATWGAVELRLIDAESLTEQQVSEILELKEPPDLNIQSMAPYGAYSAPTDPMVPSDIQYFGGKAANFGMIRRSIPDHSPVATAFSFDLWNEFMDQTMGGGNTLREEIAAILASYPTWPPVDMGALADDLSGIRALIEDETVFSPTLKQAVVDTLRDPQYSFDPDRNIRFRSSTNVEDSEYFTGAGLYDSYSGCLGDELDGDAAWYASAWPCDAAIGKDDVHAWSVSSAGDVQNSYASANGDVGNPGTFVSNACPTGACCVDGACTETTHSECISTHGGSYQGDGTTCATTTCPQPGDGQMRVTEYMYSGSGGEFIEFSNVGAQPIDMTGWSYDDDSAIPGTVDLSAFGVVDPGESVILTEDSAATFASNWDCAGVTIIGGLTVNLGRNDEINLYDALDGQVDRLTYGDEDFPGSIRARDASGWPCDVAVGANNIYGWSLSTVGDVQDSYVSAGGDVGSPGSFADDPCPTGACCIEGVCTETTRGDCLGVHGGLYQGDGTTCDAITCPEPSAGQMRITEYMSMGNGGEFIEFTNLGAEPVDMTGWSYDDESGIPGTVDLSAFGVVAPGESVILAEDPAAQFSSDWSLSGVTIIGDLTANLGKSDAIHLYDASDTLVDGLSYQQDEGPSQCDPSEAEERGVFRAIRKVFASFYNDNAFLERLRYGVNEEEVGMALLVHHSSPDEIELANGVGTLEITGGYSADLTLVTQAGATSVANPEGGAIAEQVDVYVTDTWMYLTIIRYSNLLPWGETVLEYEDEYIELAEYLMLVADEFEATTGKTEYVLDFEYKKVAPGGGALPAGGLVVKQVREVPQQSHEQTITPFLLKEPTEYVVHQGEYGDVFGLHRLKSQLILESNNLWMTEKNLAGDFYAGGFLMYLEACMFGALGGPLSSWPEASYSFEVLPYGGEATNGWVLSDLLTPRSYQLRTKYMDMLVAPAESPLLTVRDFAYGVDVEYETPVPTWTWEGPGSTTTDSIQLRIKDKEQPDDQLQTRTIFPVNGSAADKVLITTSFYWPPDPNMAGGYTAPLIRWVETIIDNVISEPIVLHGYYSQTYRPEHHNFSEHFIFEPRLEAGIPPSQLAELEEKDIRLIHVLADRFSGEGEFYYYGSDGTPCDPCANIDRGDVNRDGLVNGLDVQGFIEQLLSPIGPIPAYCAADIDHNDVVDMDDVAPFITCVLGGGCP